MFYQDLKDEEVHEGVVTVEVNGIVGLMGASILIIGLVEEATTGGHAEVTMEILREDIGEISTAVVAVKLALDQTDEGISAEDGLEETVITGGHNLS